MSSIFKYSRKSGEKSARAQLHDVDASYKDFTQVARAIKGKKVSDAKKILGKAIALEKAIPFHQHAKGSGHRSELGGKRGRYPKKEAKFCLEMLENALANARSLGLNEEKLFVAHVAAFKGNTFKRHRKFWANSATLGYGKRAIWADYVTCRAEIILEEG